MYIHKWLLISASLFFSYPTFELEPEFRTDFRAQEQSNSGGKSMVIGHTNTTCKPYPECEASGNEIQGPIY